MQELCISDTPSVTGTYCLILNLEQAAWIRIGAMGEVAFPPGGYLYVGSAFGPGGLRARLSRHVGRASRCHWHIDYFRQHAHVTGAFVTQSKRVYEHRWALLASTLPGTSIPARRFGASDCRCPAHLFHFKHPSGIGALERFLIDKLPPEQALTFLHYRENCS
ncbi:hypothetical protein D3OALGB2SA_1629 [Olavius algarvensis associated proteobacterium Delta 3]|nr:hypothetical protein D3OALGB2SA_1629 [Olavius algarvensis associated proteobacterium Delta 3]